MSIDYCAACWGRHADRPVCHVNIGFFQEAGQWAVGEQVEVKEVTCRALGDATCSYHIRMPDGPSVDQ